MLLTLAVSSTVQLVAAASFAYVSGAVLSRSPEGAARTAARAMAAWWFALAAYLVMQGGLGLLAAFGTTPLTLFVVARFAFIPLLCVAGWGLTYHVLYLYTGRASLARYVAAYYALIGVAFVYVDVATPATSVLVQAWQTSVAPKPVGLNLVYAAFGAPPILSALAYASLLPRLQSSMQRYRVALVACALMGWVGGGLAAQLGSSDFWKFFTVTILGLVTAFTVLLAYRPPRFVLARLDPAGDEARSLRHEREAGRERLRARIGELV